jgi:hypothetical protein
LLSNLSLDFSLIFCKISVNKLVLTQDVLKKEISHIKNNAKICLTYKVTRFFSSKNKKSIRSYIIEMQIAFNLANDFHGAESFLINSNFFKENRIISLYFDLEFSFPYHKSQPPACKFPDKSSPQTTVFCVFSSG